MYTHTYSMYTIHTPTHTDTDSDCITSFTVTEFPKIPTVVDEVDYSCTGHITYHGNYIHTMVTIYILYMSIHTVVPRDCHEHRTTIVAEHLPTYGSTWYHTNQESAHP